MKLPGILIFFILLLAGCSKQTAAQRDALENAKPGYQEAKTYCSQCHSLPFGDQHPPAGWPYVISRMEGYMQSAHKPMPDSTELAAITAYFQSN